MKRKFDLGESDIKEAIAWWLSSKHKAECATKDIYLTATEARDYFDRPSYGHVISAEATSKD